MARKRRSKCKQCGAPDSQGPISKRGLCSRCATANLTAAVQGLRDKSGATYERYLSRQDAGMLAYLRKQEARLDQEWRAAELANARRTD